MSLPGSCKCCSSTSFDKARVMKWQGASYRDIEAETGIIHATVKNCWDKGHMMPSTPAEGTTLIEAMGDRTLNKKIEMLQRKTSQDLLKAKEIAPLDHEAVLEYLIKELVFLKNWAEDMSLEMKSNNDIDYPTKIKMLDGYRKIAVSMADTYTSFQRLKHDETVVEASADMKAIREQLLGKIKEIPAAVIDV